MMELFQPWHLIIIMLLIGAGIVALKAIRASAMPRVGPPATAVSADDFGTSSAMKFCSECASQIPRDATLCRKCGCRVARMN